MKARYEGRSNLISSIIIGRERIFRWGRTRRSHERFSRQKWGRLCRCRKSAGYTTATNDGLPEKAKPHSRYALDLLGPSKFAPEPSPSRAYIGEFRNFVHRLRQSGKLIESSICLPADFAVGCTEFS